MEQGDPVSSLHPTSNPPSPQLGKWVAGRGECGCSLPSGTVRKTGAQRGSVTVHGQGRRGNEQAGHVRPHPSRSPGSLRPSTLNPTPAREVSTRRGRPSLWLRKIWGHQVRPLFRVPGPLKIPQHPFGEGRRHSGGAVPNAAPGLRDPRSCRHLALMSSRRLRQTQRASNPEQVHSARARGPGLGLSCRHGGFRREDSPKWTDYAPSTSDLAQVPATLTRPGRPELESREAWEAPRPKHGGSRPPQSPVNPKVPIHSPKCSLPQMVPSSAFSFKLPYTLLQGEPPEGERRKYMLPSF